MKWVFCQCDSLIIPVFLYQKLLTFFCGSSRSDFYFFGMLHLSCSLSSWARIKLCYYISVFLLLFYFVPCNFIQQSPIQCGEGLGGSTWIFLIQTYGLEKQSFLKACCQVKFLERYLHENVLYISEFDSNFALIGGNSRVYNLRNNVDENSSAVDNSMINCSKSFKKERKKTNVTSQRR